MICERTASSWVCKCSMSALLYIHMNYLPRHYTFLFKNETGFQKKQTKNNVFESNFIYFICIRLLLDIFQRTVVAISNFKLLICYLQVEIQNYGHTVSMPSSNAT